MFTRSYRSAVLVLGLCSVWRCAAFPTAIWQLEDLAKSPVIATCVVEGTQRDPLATTSERGVVMAHAALRVLRSFPQSAFHAGDRIRLDYEALPEGNSGMNGPNVPPIKVGDTLAFPLNLNPEPSSASWRLIRDEGMLLVIPAIVRDPPFAGAAQNGRSFLIYEIASALIAGTRQEVFAEALYFPMQREQRALARDLMPLLEAKLNAGDDRWTLIAALLHSSLGAQRPSVTSLRTDKLSGFDTYLSGSLLSEVLKKLGSSQKAEDALIHQLLLNSDIAPWGTGITLMEFSQRPSLVRELKIMLQRRRPGALLVARDVLVPGQKEILKDAIKLSLYYVQTPGVDSSELQEACPLIRDFGTDQQFSRLVHEIRKSQYRDRYRYDELWRNTIWSDNDRERAVLEILLNDERVDASNMQYSEIARGELTSLQKRKQ